MVSGPLNPTSLMARRQVRRRLVPPGSWIEATFVKAMTAPCDTVGSADGPVFATHARISAFAGAAIDAVVYWARSLFATADARFMRAMGRSRGYALVRSFLPESLAATCSNRCLYCLSQSGAPASTAM